MRVDQDPEGADLLQEALTEQPAVPLETKRLYDQRVQRFLDAAALREPDRVPILEPGTNTFPYHYAGYSMAEVLYDLEKTKDAIRRYHRDFDLDSGHTFGAASEGQGPMYELSRTKTFYWSGMPGNVIGDNSIQQFIEFPLVESEEYDQLVKDRSQVLLTKALPRAYGLFEPLANLNLNSLFYPAFGYNGLVGAAAQPEFQQMVQGMAQLAALGMEYGQQAGAFAQEIESMGYPLMSPLIMLVSYDAISDFLRGTMGMSTDLYDFPEKVKFILDEHVSLAVDAVLHGPAFPNRFVFIPMHKGMDGFLSDAQYEEFYFPYLLRIVDAIISVGMIPYVYTEGRYTTRLPFLKQLPKGKCVVHFEDVDMAEAKRELGDVACLTGNYPAHLLTHASPTEVIDKAKRLLDVVMPGGGYIFDFDGGLYNAKPENVEALFATIKEYGKY